MLNFFKAGGCETIAQSFQCTVEKAPDVVSGMVADSVKDVSVNNIYTEVNCKTNNLNSIHDSPVLRSRAQTWTVLPHQHAQLM